MSYKKAIASPGPNGWGDPLEIQPEDNQKIVCITGGHISPVAEKLGEVTGAPVVDGFKHPVADEEVGCCVLDCGGVARAGIMSMKKIPTVNINGGSPSGPMKQYMQKGVYVTGVTVDTVRPAAE